MFLGHAAVGLASKAVAPRLSLGTLVAAAFFLDLLWPIFLLLGWESVRIDPGNTAITPLDFVDYPISHSLVTVVLWAVLCGAVYHVGARFAATRLGPARIPGVAVASGVSAREWTGAVVVGLAVASHWFLDLLTHRPDLPLIPGGSARVGLGLWNSVPGTLLAEGGLFGLGAWIYWSRTRPRSRAGSWGLASFLAALVLIYIGNVAGPPPPGPGAIAAVGLLLWALPPWAAWVDRHRTSS